METKQLYLYNSYQKDFEATIHQIRSREIILDQTVFHPLTGGVACDTCHLWANGNKHSILKVEVNRGSKEISHFANEDTNWKAGDVILGEIN